MYVVRVIESKGAYSGSLCRVNTDLLDCCRQLVWVRGQLGGAKRILACRRRQQLPLEDATA
jgi:hypothetical protein